MDGTKLVDLPQYTKESDRHERSVSLDYLKTFIIVLVVVHHSIIAYSLHSHFNVHAYLASSGPIVDARRWFGFDVLVILNHTFFMALMFLLSGLFVWRSLQRHGSARFVRQRLIRLGVPYAVGLLLLMPVAHYPSFREGGGAPGLPAYLWQCFAVGPRPNGPIWFLGVLLMFDTTAAVMQRLLPGWSGAPSRWVAGRATRPAVVFAALLAASLVAYVPLALRFGPDRWLMIGTVPLQANRVLLYALYFAAGVVIGRGGDALLAVRCVLAQRWAAWAGLALLSYAGFLAWSEAQRRGLLPAGRAAEVVGDVGFVLVCGATSFALLAACMRWARRHVALLDALTANSYGIFMVHYIPVVWLQYALLGQDWPPGVKAAIVVTGALTTSWAAVALARRLPAIRAVL